MRTHFGIKSPSRPPSAATDPHFRSRRAAWAVPQFVLLVLLVSVTYGCPFSSAPLLESCPMGDTPCPIGCVHLESDPEACGDCDNVCPDAQVCGQGSCMDVCPAGFVQCGRSCVDISSSDEHCGGCDMACLESVCAGGVCSSCREGLTACDSFCVDLQTDSRNCGFCGNVCSFSKMCNGGACSHH